MAGAGKKTFTAGETLTASDVNTYLMEQSVMVFGGTAARSSAIPTPSEGMFAVTTDDDELDYYNGSSWVPALPIGGWTSYTPTLSQGTSTNISKTVVYAKYAQFGKFVVANVRLQSTGTGQAGQPVIVTLPVTAATSGIPAGNGGMFDASVNNYTGWIFLNSTTTAGLVSHNNADNLVGANPSFAVASGDFVNLTFMYEGV